MNLLVIGGSGFISRFVVQEALAQGYRVWYVTRGNREGIPGAKALIADRNDIPALRAAIREPGCRFDAVLDCICFNADQARVDLELLPEVTDRVIVVSTDSLYHPDFKSVPHREDGAVYMEDGSYGGQKRKMERVFLEECSQGLNWTLFRPPHMYGAGSELGCFPMHTRQKDLRAAIRAGEPIRLVGGGRYLIQPLYAGDLAKAMVAAVHNPKACNQIFGIAGPDVIQNREYFEILAKLLDAEITIEDTDEAAYRAGNDTAYLYMCHRVYDLTKLREAGLPVPATGLREGLQEQIAWLEART